MGRKCPRGARCTLASQREASQADFLGLGVVVPPAAENQAREAAVRCRRKELSSNHCQSSEAVRSIKINQPLGERCSYLADEPVAAEPAQVFVDANERPGPGSRRSGARRC